MRLISTYVHITYLFAALRSSFHSFRSFIPASYPSQFKARRTISAISSVRNADHVVHHHYKSPKGDRYVCDTEDLLSLLASGDESFNEISKA